MRCNHHDGVAHQDVEGAPVVDVAMCYGGRGPAYLL
jgi:hypothetical protein